MGGQGVLITSGVTRRAEEVGWYLRPGGLIITIYNELMCIYDGLKLIILGEHTVVRYSKYLIMQFSLIKFCICHGILLFSIFVMASYYSVFVMASYYSVFLSWHLG